MRRFVHVDDTKQSTNQQVETMQGNEMLQCIIRTRREEKKQTTKNMEGKVLKDLKYIRFFYLLAIAC